MQEKNDWQGNKGTFQGYLLGSDFIRDKIAPFIYGKKQGLKINQLLHEKLKNGGCMIDLGAGSGYYSFKACKINSNVLINAIELSDPMIHIFQKRINKKKLSNRIKIFKENVLATSLKDESADVVIAANLFHELHEPQKLVKEIYRLLKFGGVVIISEFLNTTFGKAILSHHNDDVHGPYAEGEIEDILKKQNFKKINYIMNKLRIVVYSEK